MCIRQLNVYVCQCNQNQRLDESEKVPSFETRTMASFQEAAGLPFRFTLKTSRKLFNATFIRLKFYIR